MGRRAGPGGTLRKTWGTEEELQELKKLLRKYFRTMDDFNRIDEVGGIQKELRKKCK